MALTKRQQEILVRATELIGIKENWIKGAEFGDTDDGGLDPERYCAVGAVHRAVVETTHAGKPVDQTVLLTDLGELYVDYIAVICALDNTRRKGGIVHFNDSSNTTHDDIKQAFCDTVKREVQEEEPNAPE